MTIEELNNEDPINHVTINDYMLTLRMDNIHLPRHVDNFNRLCDRINRHEFIDEEKNMVIALCEYVGMFNGHMYHVGRTLASWIIANDDPKMMGQLISYLPRSSYRHVFSDDMLVTMNKRSWPFIHSMYHDGYQRNKITMAAMNVVVLGNHAALKKMFGLHHQVLVCEAESIAASALDFHRIDALREIKTWFGVQPIIDAMFKMNHKKICEEVFSLFDDISDDFRRCDKYGTQSKLIAIMLTRGDSR